MIVVLITCHGISKQKGKRKMEKEKYSTIYQAPYGMVIGELKKVMTKEDAVALGQKYCAENGFSYKGTYTSDEAVAALQNLIQKHKKTVH